MKYKVGDKVRVRDNIVIGEIYEPEYEVTFVSEMGEFKGKTVTISEVLEGIDCYHIKEDRLRWVWTENMFESAEEDRAHKLQTKDCYKNS